MFFIPQTAAISKPIYQKTTYVAFGSETGEAKLYKIGKSTYSELTLPRSLTNVLDLRFSSDGQFLVVVTAAAPYLALFKITGSAVTEISTNSALVANTRAVDWHFDSNRLNVSRKGTDDIKVYVGEYGLNALSQGYTFGYETIALRSAINGLNAVECSKEADGTYTCGLITYSDAAWRYDNIFSGLANPFYAVAACNYKSKKTRFLIQYTETDGFNKLIIDVDGVTYQDNDPGGLGLIHSIDVDPTCQYLLGAKQSGIGIFKYDSSDVSISHQADYYDEGVQVVRFSNDGTKAFSLQKTGDAAIKIYNFNAGQLSHSMTITDSASTTANRGYADWVTIG